MPWFYWVSAYESPNFAYDNVLIKMCIEKRTKNVMYNQLKSSSLLNWFGLELVIIDFGKQKGLPFLS